MTTHPVPAARGRALGRATAATMTAVTVAITAAAALAGCGSPAVGSAVGKARAPAAPRALATSVSASGATWATVRTGGRITGGKFWQLLVRPAGSSRWRLATPPGVADNGGLAVAGAGRSLSVGFVPNALLRFTPLATTTDGGTAWSQGLFQGGLTGAPSALAVLPGNRLVAITAKAAEISGPGGASWLPLVTLRALAASAADRSCGLTRLTAVAASPAGDPLVAGQCRRAGVAGIFEHSAGGWHAVGQVLGGSLRRLRVSVLQMTSVAGGTRVLLTAGAGRSERVVPAFLAGGATDLTVGAPLRVTGLPVTSSSFSQAGGWGVVLGGRSAWYFAPPGSAAGGGTVTGVSLSLPARGASLVLGSGRAAAGGPLTALVPGLDTVAVWQRTSAGTWQRIQVIGVPSAPD